MPKKYECFINANFKISSKCCKYLKKDINLNFKKNNNNCGIFIGEKIIDSRLRETSWFQYGCNNFDSNKSKPLSLWIENDIDEYIKINNLQLSELYTKHNYKRSGCMFCLYGIKFDKDRLLRLHKLYPKMLKMILIDLKFIDVINFLNENLKEQILLPDEYNYLKNNYGQLLLF